MIRAILVGVGGYGAMHIKFFKEGLLPNVELVAVMDPFAKKAPVYPELVASGIPIYDDLDLCLTEKKPQLAYICTPIDCHKPQIEICFSHGISVLCEKPLAGTPEEIEEIREMRDRSGCKLGVGFQLSFCDPIHALKQDIRSGLLGKPVHLKTMTSWRRAETYYTLSTWKGRMKDAQGFPVRDSILSNATAHYMHNMFFLLDDEAADFDGVFARSNDIETFDTAIIHGSFRKGGQFTYVASHSAELESNPRWIYEFENAVVTYDSNGDGDIRAIFHDGTEKNYGSGNSLKTTSQKDFYMAESVEKGIPVRCSVEQIMPFTHLCEQVFNHPEQFQAFPKSLVHVNEDKIHLVTGLYEIMERCYTEGRLPDEAERAALGLH